MIAWKRDRGGGYTPAMKQKVDRILSTHVGSLPRPKDLLDLMKAQVSGLAYDPRVKSAVADCVKRQVVTGIGIVSAIQRLTVTRKKVAGIEVLPSVLLFCAFASSKSCLWSSSAFPFFWAASTAFMVGP